MLSLVEKRNCDANGTRQIKKKANNAVSSVAFQQNKILMNSMTHKRKLHKNETSVVFDRVQNICKPLFLSLSYPVINCATLTDRYMQYT